VRYPLAIYKPAGPHSQLRTAGPFQLACGLVGHLDHDVGALRGGRRLKVGLWKWRTAARFGAFERCRARPKKKKKKK